MANLETGAGEKSAWRDRRILWAGAFVLLVLGLGATVFLLSRAAKEAAGRAAAPEKTESDSSDSPPEQPPTGEAATDSPPQTAPEQSPAAVQQALEEAGRLAKKGNHKQALHALMAAWWEYPQNDQLIGTIMRAHRKLRFPLILQLRKQPLTLSVRAYISGRSELVLRDGMGVWHHHSGSPPGTHGGNDYPTYINGEAWNAGWEKAPGGDDARRRSTPCMLPRVVFPRRDVEVELVDWKGPEATTPPPVRLRDERRRAVIVFDHRGRDAGWYEARVRVSLKGKRGRTPRGPERNRRPVH
jgi:hypothetical protein